MFVQAATTHRHDQIGYSLSLDPKTQISGGGPAIRFFNWCDTILTWYVCYLMLIRFVFYPIIDFSWNKYLHSKEICRFPLPHTYVPGETSATLQNQTSWTTPKPSAASEAPVEAPTIFYNDRNGWRHLLRLKQRRWQWLGFIWHWGRKNQLVKISDLSL